MICIKKTVQKKLFLKNFLKISLVTIRVIIHPIEKVKGNSMESKTTLLVVRGGKNDKILSKSMRKKQINILDKLLDIVVEWHNHSPLHQYV